METEIHRKQTNWTIGLDFLGNPKIGESYWPCTLIRSCTTIRLVRVFDPRRRGRAEVRIAQD